MGLVGRVEDNGLSEIFHVVSRSTKSGTLVLRDGLGAAAVVIFQEGKVIQASTNDLRDSLGGLLYVKGLVDERGLRKALEIQRGPMKGTRLGQVLVEMGLITAEKLQETVRKHIENLVCMLLTWEKGSFSFEAGRPALDEDLETVTREFLIDDGLSTEYLLVESARLVDESNRNGPKPAAAGPAEKPALPAFLEGPAEERRRPVVVVTEYRPSEASAPPPVPIDFDRRPGRRPSPGPPVDRRVSSPERPPEDLLPRAGAVPGTREMEVLRTVSEGMRTQSTFTGVALLVLRYARSLADRVAMFQVIGDEIAETGRLGMKADGGPQGARPRKVKLPATGSVFAEVVRDGTPKRGRIPAGSWDSAFVAELGGTAPGEFFLVPAFCDGKVAILIYGDNASDGAPLPATTGLEVLMQQVGLAMEKAMLQERLRETPKPGPGGPSPRR
jgi:hypothetical protein